MNDAGITVLNNVTNAGPGNATWAFEWDITLNPGDTFGTGLADFDRRFEPGASFTDAVSPRIDKKAKFLRHRAEGHGWQYQPNG